MAVPFRKVSNTRGRKRRTHYKITENTIVKCPKCGWIHSIDTVKCRFCGAEL